VWWFLKNLRDELQVALLLWRLRRRASVARSLAQRR
jgi:hypothetical protein